MKKPSFKDGLSRLKAEPPPAPAAPAERVTGSTEPPPSRAGKVAIAAYFDPAVRKQLAIMAAQEDVSQAALLAEALNLLFERRGLAPIARA